MNLKFLLSLTLLLACLSGFSQTQLRYVKEPQWNIVKTYDSRYGSTLNLPNNEVAMIVNIPKADFAVVTIGDQLNQKWLTALEGFPMAIGKFNGKILVIAASDRSYFKSFTNTFIGYLLDEKTGKMMGKKVIYEGNPSQMEEPYFFFDKNGAYFKMSVRVTAMKKGVHVGIPGLALFSALKLKKDFATTLSYQFIDFDKELNQSQKTSPIMPPGQTWSASCGEDGSFMIITKDVILGKINAATYIAGKREPLKTISVPVDLHKDSGADAIYMTDSKSVMVGYFATLYKNIEKDQCLLVAKVDFKDGTFKINKEIFDKAHIKALQKSFVPVNKKIDDLDFKNISMMDVRSIKEYGDKLLVTVSPRYSVSSQSGVYTVEESVLINAFDQQIKPLYHQFIPRNYMSVLGEGSDVAFNLSGNTMRMVANQKDGGAGVSAVYAEMDFQTGQMLKINELPKDNIKNRYYAGTDILWWQEKSFTIPFIERINGLRSKVDVQFLQLSY